MFSAFVSAVLLRGPLTTPSIILRRRNLSRNLSVKYLIPDAVISHIKMHRLYMNVPSLQSWTSLSTSQKFWFMSTLMTVPARWEDCGINLTAWKWPAPVVWALELMSQPYSGMNPCCSRMNLESLNSLTTLRDISGRHTMYQLHHSKLVSWIWWLAFRFGIIVEYYLLGL